MWVSCLQVAKQCGFVAYRWLNSVGQTESCLQVAKQCGSTVYRRLNSADQTESCLQVAKQCGSDRKLFTGG